MFIILHRGEREKNQQDENEEGNKEARKYTGLVYGLVDKVDLMK